MTNGRSLRELAVVAVLTALAGCAQRGPIASYRTQTGSLKTSLARIEFENEQLRRSVDVLKAENRDFEDRLVQEEAANGELSARLDDARNLLSRRGYELDEAPRSSSYDAENSDEPAPKIPARRSNNKRRKTPFAEIPGRIEVAPPADSSDAEAAPKIRDETGPQSSRDELDRWLPVARGTSEPTRTKVR